MGGVWGRMLWAVGLKQAPAGDAMCTVLYWQEFCTPAGGVSVSCRPAHPPIPAPPCPAVAPQAERYVRYHEEWLKRCLLRIFSAPPRSGGCLPAAACCLLPAAGALPAVRLLAAAAAPCVHSVFGLVGKLCCLHY